MSISDLGAARDALADRESMGRQSRARHIGCWPGGDEPGTMGGQTIGQWATAQGLDAVIWTALPPRFGNQNGLAPTEEEVLTHFRNVSAEARRHAEEYVRRAPVQIDTRIRRRLEVELGWSPIRNDR